MRPNLQESGTMKAQDRLIMSNPVNISLLSNPVNISLHNTVRYFNTQVIFPEVKNETQLTRIGYNEGTRSVNNVKSGKYLLT